MSMHLNPSRWRVLNFAVEASWVFLACAALVAAGTTWRNRVHENVPPCVGPAAQNPFTQGE